MKKARFTEQQIIEILKLAEAGTKVADLCHKHGIDTISDDQNTKVSPHKRPELECSAELGECVPKGRRS